ncbi:hypothetical protein CRUP_006276 [Coryphaenoides rupestris]|nr:hypothetical protein CRUP_006276 [Coryphaenoides rupestris]
MGSVTVVTPLPAAMPAVPAMPAPLALSCTVSALAMQPRNMSSMPSLFQSPFSVEWMMSLMSAGGSAFTPMMLASRTGVTSGSTRRNREVTSLLRRVLPEVTPVRLASIIGVKALPPADISDIIHSTEKGDWNKLGVLDMFLGCIAKALSVQLKAKGVSIAGAAGMAAGKGVTTLHPAGGEPLVDEGVHAAADR